MSDEKQKTKWYCVECGYTEINQARRGSGSVSVPPPPPKQPKVGD